MKRIFFAHQFIGYNYVGMIPQQLIAESETGANQSFMLKNQLH